MLNIIGGSYHEKCIEPRWDEFFGSGLRGVLALCGKGRKLKLHTYADQVSQEILTAIANSLRFAINIKEIEESIEFIYNHPLDNPNYHPKVETFRKNEPLRINNLKKAIVFGMIEGNAIIEANRVVYDPQNPGDPQSFWENGSSANEIVMVLNINEARQLSKSSDLDTIKTYLFNKQLVKAAIVKCGPDGAFLLEEEKITNIPVFITDKVWSIGSGDIFTSYFGYRWLVKNEMLETAAYNASLATAYYVNSRTLPIPSRITQNFTPFKNELTRSKTVYLAGPFFTMAQRWLIRQCHDALCSVGLQIFSPLHDVGIGKAEEVVSLDIEGINQSDAIFAIVDGLDSGTLFEIGYAIAKGKSVIAFCENEKKEDLTMLEGSNCIITNDLATAIYKTVWELNKQ